VIEPGSLVEVQTAFGDWRRARAITGIVRGHSMPIVHICLPEDWDRMKKSGEEPDTWAWPAEYVREPSR
jgi:hypothetical protein